jgi:Flp pilus assembly protein CpaB
MATADDTVAVWQVVHDVPAGAAVSAGDLRATAVHFDEASAAGQYIAASRSLDPDARATRDLHAGELLAASAVVSGPRTPVRQVPLGVGPAHQPADLRPGDRVDVWAIPQPANGNSAQAPAPVLVLHDVSVLALGSEAGLAGDRQVLVGVGPGIDVATVLRQTTGAQVVLVRLAG